jgi:hypothetical protein
MIDQNIYKILFPLKRKTIEKIKNNLKEDPKKLNIIKATIPHLNVYSTFERTFSTCLGHSLQEVAAKCGNDVVNIDKQEKKTLGIDLRTFFGEGQMKLGQTTQTGTHKKDSLNKLLETTLNNQTDPFFVTALGESYEYYKDGVLYIGGERFWEKIGVNYNNLYDTIVKVIQDTYDEVERTIVPTL